MSLFILVNITKGWGFSVWEPLYIPSVYDSRVIAIIVLQVVIN